MQIDRLTRRTVAKRPGGAPNLVNYEAKRMSDGQKNPCKALSGRFRVFIFFNDNHSRVAKIIVFENHISERNRVAGGPRVPNRPLLDPPSYYGEGASLSRASLWVGYGLSRPGGNLGFRV